MADAISGIMPAMLYARARSWVRNFIYELQLHTMAESSVELKFPEKVSPDTRIARYMGLAQYLALLESQEAYFPSIAQLRGAEGNKGDKNEGRLSPTDRFMLDGSAAILSQIVNNIMPGIASGIHRGGLTQSRAVEFEENLPEVKIRPVRTPFGEIMPEDGRTHDVIYDRVGHWIDVWCWHAFEYESISMWRQYGQGEGAVCIITSAENLLGSLDSLVGSTVTFLPVSYREWLGAPEEFDSIYRMACEKSRVYSDEREVRLVVHDVACDPMAQRERAGRAVKVDLNRLCEKVVVHPDSPDWAFTAIDSLTKRHLGKGASRSQIYLERTQW